ncbi:5'-flap endonuclease [Fusarium torreyae]|uniref:Structure-specific endonuclease subunit SLX4 n=1 Tax=Fusarium torreyae TaxID=1237075 RepID=A0A9W8S3Z6_9HYPO|nr:5'-flap endonuclease [Fusarium torreyae]
MVSSDVFKSSPHGDTRRQPLQVESSSPDLPPLQDVLSKSQNQPPIQNGSRATPFPLDSTPSFISARHLPTSIEATPGAVLAPLGGPPSTISKPRATLAPVEDISTDAGFISGEPAPEKERDEDIVVVKITGKSTRKPRQQKVSKPAVQKRAKPKPAKRTQPSGDETTDKDPALTKDNDDNDTENKQAKPKAPKSRRKKTGTMSNHFPPADESEVPVNQKKIDVNEPLHLEQAPARRLDWTPPAQKTIVNIDSDSSVLKQLASSEAGQPLPVFKDLVENYACLEGPSETAPYTMTNASDEDSSFLKKRKRIELIAAKGTNQPEVVPEKSPTKKAPKKKRPRTITELATAAYRVPSQPDPEPPTASILDHFQTASNEASSTTGGQLKKTKGKGNQRRKTTKALKKKLPPKPVLLSPGAALAQVAGQDFVFGTSSQLAREDSPTVLRDLQAALRQSNQNEDVNFAIPINSDAIESPLQSKLWNAAARDAEGDLFDLDVINLTDDTSRLPEDGIHADPFGYHIGEDDPTISVEDQIPNDHNTFVELSDTMPLPSDRAVQAADGGSPYFSDGDISASTNIQRSATQQKDTGQEELVTLAEELGKEPELPPHPSRPNYEGYTDIRLAREIKRFGFKPIKRRSAMIALLDQCWQSKARMGQTGLHTRAKSPSTTSKTTKTTTSTPAEGNSKRPRGRPRKNSPSASEPQEPPPSAQPPETPKRPRGRPRKDSLGSSPGLVSPYTPKAASPLRRTTASPRHRKSAKPVIEIPDSEDSGGGFTSSPETNVEQMFSSPPLLDLSLSTNDGTEPPLTATQIDQEVVLFEHITKAVQSAPRTIDPQQPSWHEKILLYDPIVLEDLATWLNTGELSRMGYDGEVSPNDVKKWCESKSICCLWQVSHRGKERKRF